MIKDLNGVYKDITFENDSVVWPSVLEEIPGGRTVGLGTTGTAWPLDSIPSGAVVIMETATNECKILDVTVSDGVAAYGALPSGYEYLGLVRATKRVGEPFVGIVYAGTANDKAMRIPISDAMKTAIVTALPKLTFKAN